MKILISWIAHNRDFVLGTNNTDDNGPTISFHRYYYNYDKHILLSGAKSDDTRANILKNRLSILFPERSKHIEIVYMNIEDIINIGEIKSKVEFLLLKHKDDEIDIFFTPGTSIMQLSWYICHTTLRLKTRLLQLRPAKFSADKTKPELIEINVDQSSIPITAIIKESLINIKTQDASSILITPSIQPIYDKAFKIAQTDNITTLILGESGTGKENLARYIHDNSIRKDNAFITVNCSAIGESLLESRLFGYKKGAFTGADKDTKGLFEEADGGTLFLDEIGDITTYMQQSLLRVLQNKEIQPIGGKVKKINVRIISATNKDLKKMCSEDKFRWDLFYRLSVTELEVPSLRERGIEEKKLMIKHFIKIKQKQLLKNKRISFSPEAINILLKYPYPGNIRELENIIESLYVFYENEIQIDDLPNRIKDVPPDFSFLWKDAEKVHIIKVLKYFNGNKRKTCMAMGYKSINTLNKKLLEYNIDSV